MARVKLSREKRRQLIAQAAYRIARDDGVYNVTHGSVAAECEAQTSKHTVKQYFPKKSDLLLAAVELDVTGLIAAQVAKMG